MQSTRRGNGLFREERRVIINKWTVKWIAGGGPVGIKETGGEEWTAWTDKEGLLALYAELASFIAYYKDDFDVRQSED